MYKFLLSFILLLPVVAFSQSNYKKGFVINQNSDTVRGYINYQEWQRNPSSIAFKSKLDASAEKFTVLDIEYFEIEGVDAYQRFKVAISLDILLPDRFRNPIDTTIKTDVVFLKIIQKGENITLFSYTDAIKSRYYYLHSKNAVPLELRNKVQIDPQENTYVTIQQLYKNQLLYLAELFNVSSSFLQKRIKKSSYTLKDIADVIGIINNLQEDGENYKRSETRFSLGIGATKGLMKYAGDNLLAKQVTSRGTFLPSGEVGIDLILNHAAQRFILRAGLMYHTAKSEVRRTGNTGYHLLDAQTISFIPQFIANVYNSNPISVFFAAGPALNYSSYGRNEQVILGSTPKELKMKALWAGANLKAGITIKRKVELFYSTHIPLTAVYDVITVSIKTPSATAGINYLF